MIPTIFFIGEVSSGKSSLVNALACKYVTCVSLQRETFHPTKFCFRKKSDCQETVINLETIHKNNVNCRENKAPNNIKQMNIVNILKTDDLGEMDIVDFPGLNDGQDTQDKYLQCISDNLNKANMVCFVTDASTAFVKKSEYETFNKVKRMIEMEWEVNRNYIELCVVINKYDNNPEKDDDEDLKDIYKRILVNNPVYRISSHKLLCHRLLQNKKSLCVPKFMVNETKKILKDAEIHKNNFGDMLIFDKSWFVDNDLLKKGDWDNLLFSFDTIVGRTNLNAGKLLNQIYADLMNDIKKLYMDTQFTAQFIEYILFEYMKSNSSPEANKCIMYHGKIIDIKNRLKIFFEKAIEYDMNMSAICELFIGLHAQVLNESKKNPKIYKSRLIFLEYVFVKMNLLGLCKILIPFLTNNINLIEDVTLLHIINHILINLNANTLKYFGIEVEYQINYILVHFLKQNIMHHKNTISFANSNKVAFFLGDVLFPIQLPSIENKTKYDIWLINNIIHSQIPNKTIKYMVLLSTKKYNTIRQLIKDDMLDIDICYDFEQYVEPDFLKRLEIECNCRRDMHFIGADLFLDKFPSHSVYLEYMSFKDEVNGFI